MAGMAIFDRGARRGWRPGPMAIGKSPRSWPRSVTTVLTPPCVFDAPSARAFGLRRASPRATCRAPATASCGTISARRGEAVREAIGAAAAERHHVRNATIDADLARRLLFTRGRQR